MLLPEIDKKKTAKRVRTFFKKEYPRLCRLAGKSTSAIKAVVYTDMPKASAAGNSKESALVSTMWAQELLESVYKAVKQCEHESQIIIVERYGKHKAGWKVAAMLGYASTRYYEKQNTALLEFADAFKTTARGLFDDPKKADLSCL